MDMASKLFTSAFTFTLSHAQPNSATVIHNNTHTYNNVQEMQEIPAGGFPVDS